VTVLRRLTAILAADVAGYSRLMGADEEGTLRRLQAHLRELFDPKIAEHRGRIVKTTGDGLLAEFASVVDAVRCAVDVQEKMAQRNAVILAEQRIEFRIGVNLGDVMIDGDDIFGDGVNVAARLEALAQPGGICVNRAVRDQVRDKVAFSFEDLGEQIVKNIARPVRAFAVRTDAAPFAPPVAPGKLLERGRGTRHTIVIAAGLAAFVGVGFAAWWGWPSAGRTPTPVQATASPQSAPPAASTAVKPLPRLSIVVLPFANLSSDPEQEYFVDGITDDLTTDLSRISGSFVISRNTAVTYKVAREERLTH
jgi:class 3 adenylate cyclase